MAHVEIMRAMVGSIANQTYQDFELQFNMPRRSELEGVEYVYPQWMEDYGVKVFECEDHGSHTKIFPTLLRETDPDTVIITVDDDIVYHEDTITNHIKLREMKYPDCGIGFAGLASWDDRRFVTSVSDDVRVRVLEGYKSVSYLRGFFDDSYCRYALRHWCDDTVLSCMLGKRRIKKWVCHWPGDVEHPEPLVETLPVVRWKGCHTTLPYPWPEGQTGSGCAVRRHGKTRQAIEAEECFDEFVRAGWYDAY